MKTERTVRNCTVRLKVGCPRTWESFEPTALTDVRFCSECNNEVYFCATDVETIMHAKSGHCIARDRPLPSELGSRLVGRPEVAFVATDAQREAEERAARERGIDTLLGGRIAGTSRVCPDCAYPVPEFRKTCYVCGSHLGRAMQ